MDLHSHIKDYYNSTSYSPRTIAVLSSSVASSLDEFIQGSWFELGCALLLLVVSVSRMATRGSVQSPRKWTQPFARETESEKQVRKLIYDLFHKANREAPNVFDLYDKIVKQQHINFRDYIRDDGHAQALFISLVTHAINSKKRDLVYSLLADMEQMGIPRNLCFYASVMKVFATKGNHQEAVNMYDFMIHDKLKPDSTMYICLLNNAVACNDTVKAQQFFSETCEVQTPSLRTCMTVLRTYQKDGNWQSAVNILNKMKRTGVAPDNLVFNSVLGVCVSAGQVDTAAKLVEAWKHDPGMVDVISYNTVLKGYSQQSNLEKADALLMRMEEDANVSPNLISFNTVMDGAIRTMQKSGGHFGNRRSRNPRQEKEEKRDFSSCPNMQALSKKSWEILDRLGAVGLRPDRITCSTLIKGMHLTGCSVQEIDRAMTLLKTVGPEALQSKDTDNARLHEVLFNSMLDACVNARDLNRMAEVFTIMRDCKVPVSAVTFGTLIKAFGHAGLLDRVHEVWAEMRQARVRPTAVTYGCCIDACIRNGDLDSAWKTFEEMKPDGCAPNSVIYTSLIRAFSRSRQTERAIALYKDMRHKGVDNDTCNSVLDIIARNVSEPTELARVLEDMHVSDTRPDLVQSTLIKACCAAGDVAKAMSLFEQQKQEGLLLDDIAFNSLLTACANSKNVDYAEAVFAYMLRVNVKPSSVTFSILVKMYGKAKMLDKAIEMMELMENEYKEKPNLFVYTCLIQACVQNTQLMKGWDFFHSMQEKGLEPDAVSYATLIYGCVYSSKFDLAMTLVKQAHSKPLQLQSEVLTTLLTAVKRKGTADQAAELDSLMNDNAVAVDPKARRGCATNSFTNRYGAGRSNNQGSAARWDRW